jgi:hypothetical protein
VNIRSGARGAEGEAPGGTVRTTADIAVAHSFLGVSLCQAVDTGAALTSTAEDLIETSGVGVSVCPQCPLPDRRDRGLSRTATS